MVENKVISEDHFEDYKLVAKSIPNSDNVVLRIINLNESSLSDRSQ